MPFFSLSSIIRQVKSVVYLYPLELLATLLGTGFATAATYPVSGDTQNLLARLMLIAALALPSWFAITMRGRFRGYSNRRKAIEYAVVAAVIAGFFCSLSKEPDSKDWMRFALLNITAHLLVSCAGFIGRGTTHSFWQFNKHLFLRIITSIIFSGVLYAGLAGALAALTSLFQIHIDYQWYSRLYIWIAGVFNTVFFLAGVPANKEMLEEDVTYPKILKIFTQYVLVPLVVIYLAILLAYEAKIVATWKLPNGWVSNLIIAYGIAGILSILLVYPIRSADGNKWIKAFSRWFYVLLLPLVGLMFIAIGKRIGIYGFTEPRVFVLAIAIWLGAMAVYFLVRRNGDIRVIPFSLALTALVLSAGPLSCFQIALYSQRSKLHQLLADNNMIKGHKAVAPPAGQKISFDDNKHLSSTLAYLCDHQDTVALKRYFDISKIKGSRWNHDEDAGYLLSQVRLEYIADYQDSPGSPSSNYSFKSKAGFIHISGYDECIEVNYYGDREENDLTQLHVKMEDNFGYISVFKGDTCLVANIDATSLLDKFIAKYINSNSSIPQDEMTITVAGKGCTVCFAATNISGTKDKKDQDRDLRFDGFVLIKWDK